MLPRVPNGPKDAQKVSRSCSSNQQKELPYLIHNEILPSYRFQYQEFNRGLQERQKASWPQGKYLKLRVSGSFLQLRISFALTQDLNCSNGGCLFHDFLMFQEATPPSPNSPSPLPRPPRPTYPAALQYLSRFSSVAQY